MNPMATSVFLIFIATAGLVHSLPVNSIDSPTGDNATEADPLLTTLKDESTTAGSVEVFTTASSSSSTEVLEADSKLEEPTRQDQQQHQITSPPLTTKAPLLTHVGVPFIVDMNLLRSNTTGKRTNLDLGILGGFIRVNLDRHTNSTTGVRSGPISVSILGQKIYGNRRRRSLTSAISAKTQ